MNTIIVDDELKLIEKLSQTIEELSNVAINEKGKFFIGLSGGSLTKYLSIGLPGIKTDFSKWIVFFCDERVVPDDNPDSTFGIYKNDLLPKIPLKEDQFVKIKQGVSAEEAAIDYASKIAEQFPGSELPKFDLLLLGMGPDGHTCSLFPGHKLLNEKSSVVACITDSPKPPPSRITLTYPVINNSKCCIFALAGEGKADMVKRVLVDKEDLPARNVNPTNGKLLWIMDKSASKYIK